MWNTMEEEVKHRRALLRLAAKGNVQARKELEQEYHASVYSAAQVATSFTSSPRPPTSRSSPSNDPGTCDTADGASRSHP